MRVEHGLVYCDTTQALNIKVRLLVFESMNSITDIQKFIQETKKQLRQQLNLFKKTHDKLKN